MTQVHPHLFIGDWFDAKGPCEGLDAVVCVAIDDYAQAAYSGELEHHVYPLVDGPGNKPELMKKAIDMVDSLLLLKKRVMVHCVAGKSRSVVVAAAALTRYESYWDGAEFDEQLENIFTKRHSEHSPGAIVPHPALVELAKSLR